MSIVRTIIVILSLWGLHASSFCQTYDWAAGASRPSGTANVICHPTGITNSYDKFTYSTGRFFTPASAFLNFGAFQLNTGGAFGVSYDVFLVKYDVNGNVVWARQAGSERDDRGHDVKCDTNNNIIVVGEFDSRLAPGGTADYFGIPIASQYAKDIFISKVAPNGAAIWSKSIGGDAAEGARGVAVDKNNNIYITG
ncbi:MAG: SBBP repeat-containing protein, partial [Flavobacteriales bacterium]|nr:SBBP repeat-containing protein [Flavobacteriales bacterium]